MEASKAGNKDAAMQCVQAKDREVLQKMEAQQKAGKEIVLPKDFAYKIGGERITGDTATVTITSNQEGKDETREIRVVKEGGAWKLDLIPDEMLGIMGAAGGPGGIEAMKEMGEKMQKAMGDQMKKALEDAAKEAEEGK
jgi:hypothetical protein